MYYANRKSTPLAQKNGFGGGYLKLKKNPKILLTAEDTAKTILRAEEEVFTFRFSEQSPLYHAEENIGVKVYKGF